MTWDLRSRPIAWTAGLYLLTAHLVQAQPPPPAGPAVTAVAFSPDGTTLAASPDDVVKLWDVETGRLLRTFAGHLDDVNSVTFSPDGTTLASASDDNTVKLWDVGSGRLPRTLERWSLKGWSFQGHRHDVHSVAFSPDGRTLASGSENNTVKLWDVESGELLRTFRTASANLPGRPAPGPSHRFLYGRPNVRLRQRELGEVAGSGAGRRRRDPQRTPGTGGIRVLLPGRTDPRFREPGR